jgi:hypothetical protein
MRGLGMLRSSAGVEIRETRVPMQDQRCDLELFLYRSSFMAEIPKWLLTLVSITVAKLFDPEVR